jgi:hypothetical protein
MTPKLIKFDDDLSNEIQKYANEHFNGNFSEAVRYLCAVEFYEEADDNDIH